MMAIKKLAKSLIGVSWLINLSCNNNSQHLISRPFFAMTKSDYYDKSLDSLGIIGHFGLDSVNTIIDNTKYWKFRNSKHNVFDLEGMLRSEGDTIFILVENSENNKSKYCKEQVLFIFNNNALNKSWAIDYSCNASIVSGDSIFLNRIYFDKDLNDTLYVYDFKSFLKSTQDNKDLKVLSSRTIITVSKSIGIIQLTFASLYNRTRLNIYPNFERLDSNLLMPNYQ